ncbi:MAG: redoxin domain-containing protein [Pseudomonadales bacterium]|nr:redoxin domain-containing protein [Pseudomonadales bacterium]
MSSFALRQGFTLRESVPTKGAKYDGRIAESPGCTAESVAQPVRTPSWAGKGTGLTDLGTPRFSELNLAAEEVHHMSSFARTIATSCLGMALAVGPALHASYVDDWGPATGTELPKLSMQDVDGNDVTASDLSGSHGLLFFVVRATGWDGVCQDLVREINQHFPALASNGMGLAALSYDPVEQNKRFSKTHNLDVPLLSDVNFDSARALGILDQSMPERYFAFGVSKPGVLFVNNDGAVELKCANENPDDRTTVKQVLADLSSHTGLQLDRVQEVQIQEPVTIQPAGELQSALKPAIGEPDTSAATNVEEASELVEAIELTASTEAHTAEDSESDEAEFGTETVSDEQAPPVDPTPEEAGSDDETTEILPETAEDKSSSVEATLIESPSDETSTEDSGSEIDPDESLEE